MAIVLLGVGGGGGATVLGAAEAVLGAVLPVDVEDEPDFDDEPEADEPEADLGALAGDVLGAGAEVVGGAIAACAAAGEA